MAAVRTNPVSFDNALAREQARQKRKRQGGKHTQLSDRLIQHDYDRHFDPVELAVPPVKKPRKQQPQQQHQEPMPPPPPPPPSLSSIDEDCERAVQSILELCRSDVTEQQQQPQVLQEEAYSCPFHYTLLESGQTDNDWLYYKCPVQSCAFFCGADRVADWVFELSRALHPCYKEQPSEDLKISLPFTCYCQGQGFHDLKLKKSTTVKNPNRFFLSCKKGQCKFFQWLDQPFSKKLGQQWNLPQ